MPWVADYWTCVISSIYLFGNYIGPSFIALSHVVLIDSNRSALRQVQWRTIHHASGHHVQFRLDSKVCALLLLWCFCLNCSRIAGSSHSTKRALSIENLVSKPTPDLLPAAAKKMKNSEGLPISRRNEDSAIQSWQNTEPEKNMDQRVKREESEPTLNPNRPFKGITIKKEDLVDARGRPAVAGDVVSISFKTKYAAGRSKDVVLEKRVVCKYCLFPTTYRFILDTYYLQLKFKIPEAQERNGEESNLPPCFKLTGWPVNKGFEIAITGMQEGQQRRIVFGEDVKYRAEVEIESWPLKMGNSYRWIDKDYWPTHYDC